MIKRILNCQRQHWEPVLILAIAVCFFSYRLDFTEEAEVYATYINAQLLRNPLTKIPYSRLVIKDHTSGDFRDLLKQEIAKLGPKLDSYTAKDFIARNARYFGGFSLTSPRKGFPYIAFSRLVAESLDTAGRSEVGIPIRIVAAIGVRSAPRS